MRVRKIRQDTLRFIGYYILSGSLTVLCKTLKIKNFNYQTIEDLEKKNMNYVLAFWHGTMLLPWYLHRRKKMVALISKSKDGDLLARLLKNWGYLVVRGSSTSGGDVALGIMIDYAKNNRSIAVTPDGPKGPSRKLKAGAVITAKKSSIPLVLLGTSYKNKKVLNSWDKFEIPKPFSEAMAIYSDPIFIEEEISYEETSRMIEYCEAKLNELQNEAAKI